MLRNRTGHRANDCNHVHDLGFSCGEISLMASGQNRWSANLLLFPQSQQTNAGYLHHLEADTGNITLGLTSATKARDQDFIVLVDKVQTTIILAENVSAHPRNEETTHTGTKAVTFLPFLINCTRTHLRMAELGCLASTPTFSKTMPFA